MQSDSTAVRRARVLAVDDSPVMQVLVSAALEARGFSVKTVDSGFAALEACRQEPFDVVVLDVEMPGGMDGLQVGRLLREDPACSDPLIAMHTSIDEETVREHFEGYDAFLSKPCAAVRLGDCIGDLLQVAPVSNETRRVSSQSIHGSEPPTAR